MASFLAPAKINLFLHVLGRRTDGYHELSTFFQFVDIMDELEIDVSENAKIERGRDHAGIEIDDDLAIRAAHALRDHVDRPNLGATISIDKHIPIGAGLGGGSSDAASTLLALNSLWQLHLDRQELAAIGVGLGADVPVFVHGRAGWASGIGEQISWQDMPPQVCILMTPPVHVSTAEVFASLGSIGQRSRLNIDLLMGATKPVEFDRLPVDNDLESVVRARFSEVDRAMDWLAGHGNPRMSGSGGSVFMFVENRRHADSILSRRPTWCTRAWYLNVVQTLNHHPLNALKMRNLDYPRWV